MGVAHTFSVNQKCSLASDILTTLEGKSYNFLKLWSNGASLSQTLAFFLDVRGVQS